MLQTWQLSTISFSWGLQGLCITAAMPTLVSHTGMKIKHCALLMITLYNCLRMVLLSLSLSFIIALMLSTIALAAQSTCCGACHINHFLQVLWLRWWLMATMNSQVLASAGVAASLSALDISLHEGRGSCSVVLNAVLGNVYSCLCGTTNLLEPCSNTSQQHEIQRASCHPPVNADLSLCVCTCKIHLFAQTFVVSSIVCCS